MEHSLEELDNVHYLPGRFSERFLRYQALKALEEKELEGIYHLVESHAPGLRSKAILRYEKIITFSKADQKLSLSKDHLAFDCKNVPLERKINQMLGMIEDMPKEWTIVQLTSQFSPEETLELGLDKYQTNPIHISVFNCGTKEASPFCVTVSAPRDPVNGKVVNLASEMHSIITENKSILSESKSKASFSTYREREVYHEKREDIDSRLKKMVEDMQNMWLKEWRCLLIGNYVNEKVETDMKEKLKDFLNREAPDMNISERTLTLLLLIAKGAYYLKFNEVKQAIQYCFSGSEAKTWRKGLALFIKKLADDWLLLGEKRHPVLLVVDDALDCFPWEMIDVFREQSVSRVPSLHFAYALFKEYEDDIQDGFKIINDFENGSYIVNPDLDLKNMEARMGKFLNYWLPSWEGLVGKKPTDTEFEQMLTTANIFSYHGHGAGTQFFSMERIQKIRIKAVVLLFGCGSTKLCELGPQVEMYGAHQMYLIACSPCVVGMLWQVTDADTDLLTTEFISQWLPSTANIHWRCVDKLKWKKTQEIEFSKSKRPRDDTNASRCHEAELLKALSMSKNSDSYYLTKAAIIARGIPVKIVV